MRDQARRVGLLVGLVMLIGALAPAPSDPPDPNRALAEEQLKLAQQALADLDSLNKAG